MALEMAEAETQCHFITQVTQQASCDLHCTIYAQISGRERQLGPPALSEVQRRLESPLRGRPRGQVGGPQAGAASGSCFRAGAAQ